MFQRNIISSKLVRFNILIGFERGSYLFKLSYNNLKGVTTKIPKICFKFVECEIKHRFKTMLKMD